MPIAHWTCYICSFVPEDVMHSHTSASLRVIGPTWLNCWTMLSPNPKSREIDEWALADKAADDQNRANVAGQHRGLAIVRDKAATAIARAVEAVMSQAVLCHGP